MSLTNIQGRGYALQGIAGITRRKRCFIGRKIGLLFVFCLVLSMTRDSQAFTHCEESSFQTSWPRVQEDDQMVIRGAGEQRHLSLSLHWGEERVWTRCLCMVMPVWQLMVSCAHPSSYGEETLPFLASSVLTTEPSRLFS